MKQVKVFLVFFLFVFAVSSINTATAQYAVFKVTNSSLSTFEHIYFSTTDDDSWGADKLMINGTQYNMPTGNEFTMSLTQGCFNSNTGKPILYDMKIVDEDGNECTIYDVKLCEQDLDITRDMLIDCLFRE